MRIWKYPLEATDDQIVMMPRSAKLLTVQMQGNKCCLWALCNTRMPLCPRHITICGTGHPIHDDPGEYIATFQMHNGLIFHVFDQPEGE